MHRQKISSIVIGAGVVAFLFIGLYIYRVFSESSGVAANVQELASAYKNAGPEYAVCYTNTFFQNMPFVEPIDWKCPSVRPFVSVTSRVDVIAFKRKMALEPFNYLFDQSREGTPVAIFEIHHRAGEWVVSTMGSLNLSSGAFSMSSHQRERMLDDAEWRHLNKSRVIDFNFEPAN